MNPILSILCKHITLSFIAKWVGFYFANFVINNQAKCVRVNVLAMLYVNTSNPFRFPILRSSTKYNGDNAGNVSRFTKHDVLINTVLKVDLFLPQLNPGYVPMSNRILANPSVRLLIQSYLHACKY